MGRIGNSEHVKNRQSSIKSSESYHILDIEIDGNINACSSKLCDVSDREIPLYKYTDIPDFLQGNPYVIQGYRVMLPFSLCLKRFDIASRNCLLLSRCLVHHLPFLIILYFSVYLCGAMKVSTSGHICSAFFSLCC